MRIQSLNEPVLRHRSFVIPSDELRLERMMEKPERDQHQQGNDDQMATH